MFNAAGLNYKYMGEVGLGNGGKLYADFTKSAGRFSKGVVVSLDRDFCTLMHEHGMQPDASVKDIENSNEASHALLAMHNYEISQKPSKDGPV